jgi:hypothetical protein
MLRKSGAKHWSRSWPCCETLSQEFGSVSRLWLPRFNEFVWPDPAEVRWAGGSPNGRSGFRRGVGQPEQRPAVANDIEYKRRASQVQPALSGFCRRGGRAWDGDGEPSEAGQTAAAAVQIGRPYLWPQVIHMVQSQPRKPCQHEE